MIGRLLVVEVRRLLARRAVRLTSLVVLGIVLVAFGNEARTSRKVPEDLKRRIEALEAQGYELCAGFAFADGGGAVPADTAPPAPGEVPIEGPGDGPIAGPPVDGGPVDEDLSELYQACSREFRLREELPGAASAFGILVVVAAFAVGATAGGAEWSAGTMQALLFWEPRRVRVILAKAAALVAIVLAFAVVVQLVVYAFAGLVALTGGTAEGATERFWNDTLGRSVRIALLPAFSALLAFAIAGFTRNTGFALGTAFVYFAILENAVRNLRPRWQQHLIAENLAGWVENGIRLTWYEFDPAVGGIPHVVRIGAGRAALVLGIYLAVVVGALTVSFTRRDVT